LRRLLNDCWMLLGALLGVLLSDGYDDGLGALPVLRMSTNVIPPDRRRNHTGTVTRIACMKLS